MQKLEVKVLYGQLTYKEQKNLIKLSEWSNHDFERIFGVKGFMESDFQMRGKDLIGQRFGRLVVIEKLPSKNRRCWWKCKCDCGNFKDVPTKYLTEEEITQT